MAQATGTDHQGATAPARGGGRAAASVVSPRDTTCMTAESKSKRPDRQVLGRALTPQQKRDRQLPGIRARRRSLRRNPRRRHPPAARNQRDEPAPDHPHALRRSQRHHPHRPGGGFPERPLVEPRPQHQRQPLHPARPRSHRLRNRHRQHPRGDIDRPVSRERSRASLPLHADRGVAVVRESSPRL